MKKHILSLLVATAFVFCSLLQVGAATVFRDVKDPSWYSESVQYVVSHGYMTGVGNDQFSPDTSVTRAQLVQILYAAEKKPSHRENARFSDVPVTGKWYSSAVYWGAEHKIVAGYPDQTFRPDQAVSREQLVSVLYKYAVYKEKATENDGAAMGLAGFKDHDQVADYARPGMLWAVQNGIIAGTKIGLEPKSPATRAQMAVIIRALMERIILTEDSDELPVVSDSPEDATPLVPSVEPASGTDDGSATTDPNTPENSNGEAPSDSSAPNQSGSDGNDSDTPSVPAGNTDPSDSAPADSGTSNPSPTLEENELPLIPANPSK